MTRDLIHTLGLGSGNDPHVRACPVTDSLCYDGGGSDAGFAASCNAPQTGQGMNPAARLANDSDQDCARANGLHFPGRCEVVRQAITVIANTHFNGALQQIKVTDVGNIFSCAASALFWDQIPGSTRGHRRINKYAPDGFSAATDLFAAKSHGLVNGTVTNFPSAESPRDRFYWRTHFPRCVTEIFGSGADAAMGYIVANDPDAIGFEDLGVVQTGNYSLAICNDLENGCVDADDFKLPTPFNIAHGRYYYSRPMYFNHVVGDGFQLPPDQQALLDAACNEQTSCSVLARYVDNKAFFPALRCTPDDPGPGKASN
jgi:ABC-type phosphate transport system substrate-binding protein